jgi:hypothetical protein
VEEFFEPERLERLFRAVAVDCEERDFVRGIARILSWPPEPHAPAGRPSQGGHQAQKATGVPRWPESGRIELNTSIRL